MAIQRPHNDPIHAAHFPTIDSPSTSLDDASILLSMESQLSSLYAERSQLHAALGVSDADEVIALVGELKTRAEQPVPSWGLDTPESPSSELPAGIEGRMQGARKVITELLSTQRDVELAATNIDAELDSLASQREDLEARLARVAAKRTELEARRGSLDVEGRDVTERLGQIEQVMAQLDALMGGGS